MKIVYSAPPPAVLPLLHQKPTYAIARSCCEGLLPCRIFADDPANPTAAIVSLVPFGIAFAVGDACQAGPLLESIRSLHPWYEIIDPEESWHPHLAAWSSASHATVRYAFTQDAASFDTRRLQALSTPPEGCMLAPYDRNLLTQARAQTWSEDQMGAFPTMADFLKNGFGMALLRDGQIISGCSSFCRQADGYEIQVDTHPDHRGKGLAICVCSAFILALLEKGLLPHWDAANATSYRLAKRLGFIFTHAYPAWVLAAPQMAAQAIREKITGE